MRPLNARLVAVATVLFLALAVTQLGDPAAVVASIATVVLASAIAGALVVAHSRELTVGARAQARRQALYAVPEPSHPTTAGRPRTRAPSRVVSAA